MRGDSGGLVNPTWSKVKRSRCFGVTAQAFEGGPPEPAGRPLEAVGNGSRRWMVARLDRGSGDRTRPTGRLVRRPAGRPC